LTSFNIPSGVTTIGDYAFYGCKNLEAVDIPTGVTTIGVHSFRECSKLESVNTPEGVTLIKGNAFANCSGLTTLTLPASITSIQGDVFSNCTSLTTVNIASIKDFCEITFDKDNSNPLYNGKAALYVNSEKITNLVIPAEITEIKKYAFNGYTSLTSVKVHLGVTKIGNDAFKGCTGLTKAEFESISHLCGIEFGEDNSNNPEYSNPLFYAANLYIGDSSTPTTELKIPTDVTSIGQAAFAGAKNITKVEFPSSLNTIGRRAFLNCTGLLIANYSSMDQVTGIDYNRNAEANPLTYAPVLWIKGAPTDAIELTESVDESQFNKCTWLKHVTVKAGNEGNVKYIGKNAFRGCTSLQDIDIASCAIDSIHEGALQGCSALKVIQLPTTLKFIGNTAFYGCTQLPFVTIPSGVTYIGMQAFRDCRKIERITIPSSATQLGTGIFMWCSKLEKATIESAITELPDYTFEGCFGLTDLILPSSITTIGEYAFHACSSLKDFPSSITGIKIIKSNAFNGCLGFKNLHLYEPIQYIDESAFEGCDSLVNLTIPTSVDYIFDKAFKQSNNITSLKNVYCYKTTAPKASSGAFGGKENTMTLYIPKGETTGYSDTPWSNFIPASETIGEDVNLYFYINDVKVDSIKGNPGSAIDATEIPKPELSGRQSFSGWHEAIPGTMPAKNKEFYGYIADTITIGGLTYLLEPIEAKKQNGKKNRATVLAPLKDNPAIAVYYTENEITIPVTVQYGETYYEVIAIADTAFIKSEAEKIIFAEGSKINSIGSYAFRDSKKLERVDNFPSSVTKLQEGVFRGCSQLLRIPPLDHITDIGAVAFYGCSNITELEIPTNVKKMNVESFRATGLKKVKIHPDGLNSISNYAFYGCSKLAALDMPNNISTIGNSAFAGCTALETLSLPVQLTTIGNEAFKGCNSIRQVSIAASTAPQGDKSSFADSIYIKATLYKPANGTGYDKDPWKSFNKAPGEYKKYNLIYQLDEDAPESNEVSVGETIAPKEKPSDEDEKYNGRGYNNREWTGWIGEPSVMPAKDVTVTARFKYNVTYELDTTEGGEQHKIPDSIQGLGVFCGDTLRLAKELAWPGHRCYYTWVKSETEPPLQGTLDKGLPKEESLMPAKDITIKIKYEQSEQDTTINDIKYKVVLLEVNNVAPHAEVIESPNKTGNIDIPASITYNTKTYPVTIINDNAFNSNNSRSITGVTLHSGLEKIGARAFRDCRFTELTIPATVKNIGNEAFLYCTTLQKVSFEADTELTELPNGAFQSCSSLGSIELPEGLTTIGVSAFAGCNALTAVKFPSTIDNIGDYAFSGSTAIETVTATSTNLPTATSTIFDDKVYDNALLKVLTGTTHDDDPWKLFDKVQEGEDGGSGTGKCEPPTISYDKDTLKFKSATPGATIVYDIKDKDITKDTNASPSTKKLTKTYTITAYAKKSGMLWSDEVTATITWRNGKPEFEGFTDVKLEKQDPTKGDGDVNGDGHVNGFDAIMIMEVEVGQRSSY
jgi:hypothetical protein